jgi:hypothetical protein
MLVNVNNILVAFLIAQFSFILGFLLGRNTQGKQIIHSDSDSIFKKNESVELKRLKSIKIDDAKFVTNVSSDDFQKSNVSLGKNSSVEDDIENSVNRLAQLKKSK